LASALATTDAASGGGFTFRKTWTSAIDLLEEPAGKDLSLDPADTERCA
jgi:hypothetical protein